MLTRPLIVQYLYVHGLEEGFHYPSARSTASVGSVAVRYLECALSQVASLRLKDTPCDLVLATNAGETSPIGRSGRELLGAIEALGVQILPTEYRHRPSADVQTYVASRYVLDAILSATEGEPAERKVLLTDLDCIWPNPQRVFDAVPADGEIGCVYIPYPPDWDAVGFGEFAVTRTTVGELSQSLGGSQTTPPWVGGELLCGTPSALRGLVTACEEIDQELLGRGQTLPTEEQVLTLAGALGRVRFRDVSRVAGRIHTGARHEAPPTPDVLELGLWHLPSEKGLSLRRTASAVRRGRTEGLRRDFADPGRTARRFNVEGTGLARRLRDDGWLVMQRARTILG